MASYLLKYTLSKVAHTVFQKTVSSIYHHPSSVSDQLLEPFSTIIRLAMISFKEDGTKIAVSNHRMYIQSPSPFQGAIRTACGHNREEIHYLLKPIVKSLELYPAVDAEGKIVCPHVYDVYKLAVEGLKKLKRNYGNGTSTVSHSIDLYISIIDTHIKDGSKMVIDSFQSTDGSASSSHKPLDIDQLFKGLWTLPDFELVCRMFQSATNCRDTHAISYYIDSIDNIIKAKENTMDSCPLPL